MKTLELEQIGLRELDAVEMKNTDGGFWELALAILGAGYCIYESGKAVGREIYYMHQ